MAMLRRSSRLRDAKCEPMIVALAPDKYPDASSTFVSHNIPTTFSGIVDTVKATTPRVLGKGVRRHVYEWTPKSPIAVQLSDHTDAEMDRLHNDSAFLSALSLVTGLAFCPRFLGVVAELTPPSPSDMDVSSDVDASATTMDLTCSETLDDDGKPAELVCDAARCAIVVEKWEIDAHEYVSNLKVHKDRPPPELISIALQTLGLSLFLARNFGICHNDLYLRNCLVRRRRDWDAKAIVVRLDAERVVRVPSCGIEVCLNDFDLASSDAASHHNVHEDMFVEKERISMAEFASSKKHRHALSVKDMPPFARDPVAVFTSIARAYPCTWSTESWNVVMDALDTLVDCEEVARLVYHVFSLKFMLRTVAMDHAGLLVLTNCPVIAVTIDTRKMNAKQSAEVYRMHQIVCERTTLKSQ